MGGFIVANLPPGFELESSSRESNAQASPSIPNGFEIEQAGVSENVVNTNGGAGVGGASDLQPVAGQPQEQGFFAGVKDAFTGESQQTPEIKGLGEIGNAPELNEFSMGSFKTALGLLASGDEEKGIGIIKQNIPDSTFRKDSKGNTIASLPSGDYLINAPGLSGQDIARFAAQALAFTPAGRAPSLLGAGVASGATELALQAGASQVGGGEIDPADVALSAGLGVGGKALENVISAGTRAVRGAIPEDSSAIIKAGKEADVPVLTTDVIQPDTLAGKLARSTGETIPIAGTGGVRAAQQKGREKVAESFAEGVTPQYSEVVESLRSKTKGALKAAGNRLNAIGTKMDEAGQVSTSNTIESIDNEIASLSSAGRVPDDATIDTLTQYKKAIEEGQSFTSLDTLRSDFRESVKGDRMTLPTRSNAAMTKIYNSMTRDLKSSIKDNLGEQAANKWTQAKGFYGKELDMIKKSRLKNVLDKGDVTPENVKNIIFSQKPSEMKALYSSLDGKGRSATRATVINEIVERASKKVGGLTPNSLATELNRANPQINAFFKGEERKQLVGLKNFIDATRRAQDAAVATPTGQSLAGIIAGGGVVANPTTVLPALATVGGMARAYESAPVRNALLRLASIKKGTDAYDKAVIEATQALTAATQATNKDNK